MSLEVDTSKNSVSEKREVDKKEENPQIEVIVEEIETRVVGVSGLVEGVEGMEEFSLNSFEFLYDEFFKTRNWELVARLEAMICCFPCEVFLDRSKSDVKILNKLMELNFFLRGCDKFSEIFNQIPLPQLIGMFKNEGEDFDRWRFAFVLENLDEARIVEWIYEEEGNFKEFLKLIDLLESRRSFSSICLKMDFNKLYREFTRQGNAWPYKKIGDVLEFFPVEKIVDWISAEAGNLRKFMELKNEFKYEEVFFRVLGKVNIDQLLAEFVDENGLLEEDDMQEVFAKYIDINDDEIINWMSSHEWKLGKFLNVYDGFYDFFRRMQPRILELILTDIPLENLDVFLLSFDLRETLLFMRNNPEIFEKLTETGARNEKLNEMFSVYRVLGKLQRPAFDVLHCKINLNLQPLLNSLRKGGIMIDCNEEFQYLIDYVEEFGSVNMLLIAKIFIYIQKNELQDELKKSEMLQIVLEENFGGKIVEEIMGANSDKELKKLGKRLLKEIHLLKNNLLDGLLIDTYDEKLLNPIGIELFNVIRPTTQWNANFDTRALLATIWWRQKSLPKMSLKDGYIRREYEIKKKGKKDVLGEEREMLLTKKLKPFVEQIEARLNPVVGEVFECSFNPFYLLETLKKDLGGLVDEQIPNLVNRMEEIKKEYGSCDPNCGDFGRGDGRGLKKIKGIEQLIGRMKQKRDELLELTVPRKNIEEQDIVRLLDELSDLAETTKQFQPLIDEVLMRLSVFHCYITMDIQLQTEQIVEFCEILKDGGWQKLDLNRFKNMFKNSYEFFVNFFVAHYLFENQNDVEHTNHLPLAELTVKRLNRLWKGVVGALDEGVRIFDCMYEADHGGEIEGTEMIEFVPSKGILRMIAGEIGDACYTRLSYQLADGKYEDTTAVVMVRKSKLGEKFLDGSFLLIETETDDGEAALIIRANNPRLKMFDSLDTDSLIEATFKYARDVAKIRGISADNILIPLDGVGRSSSNRAQVAEYYGRNFGGRQKIGVNKSPDTCFNGYENYNKFGLFGLVSIGNK